jgi:two-component system KDP operon response regulator KdpE
MSDEIKKKCVLVVDDQPRIIRFIEIYLRLKGFDVISATSGLKALELARSRAPDIMLLDVIMPDMDGFEVMRRLRDFSRMPVIAISASPGRHSDAEDMGADDFISKPFQTEEILVRINHLLGFTPDEG